jgi:hypothetical protein
MVTSLMNNVRKNIVSIEWFRTGENQYLGGNQEGVLYVLDFNGNRKQLNSVSLLGNGAVHRQTLDDLDDIQWSKLQAEYDAIMEVPTTSGYANGRVYKTSSSRSIGPRKKVWRLC